jgi:hypothetical protein
MKIFPIDGGYIEKLENYDVVFCSNTSCFSKNYLWYEIDWVNNLRRLLFCSYRARYYFRTGSIIYPKLDYSAYNNIFFQKHLWSYIDIFVKKYKFYDFRSEGLTHLTKLDYFGKSYENSYVMYRSIGISYCRECVTIRFSYADTVLGVMAIAPLIFEDIGVVWNYKCFIILDDDAHEYSDPLDVIEKIGLFQIKYVELRIVNMDVNDHTVYSREIIYPEFRNFPDKFFFWKIIKKLE